MIELEPGDGRSHSLPSKQQSLQIAAQPIVVVMCELAVDPHDRNHRPAAILQDLPIYGHRSQVAAFVGIGGEHTPRMNQIGRLGHRSMDGGRPFALPDVGILG